MLPPRTLQKNKTYPGRKSRANRGRDRRRTAYLGRNSGRKGAAWVFKATKLIIAVVECKKHFISANRFWCTGNG